MCTVTLSYNDNDKAAIEKLEALLSSGLFTQIETNDDLIIDSSDASLFEIDPNMTPVTKDLTPDELEKMIVSDIHSVYAAHHAV